MKFTEAQLEQAYIELREKESMQYAPGAEVREIENNVAEEPAENDYPPVDRDEVYK